MGSALGSFVGALLVSKLDPETNSYVVLGVMAASAVAVPMLAGSNFSTSVAMAVAGTLVAQFVVNNA